MGALPSGLVLALAISFSVVIGFVDYQTGYEMAMGVFHLPAVLIVAWYVGQRAGMAMALVCALIWYAADTGHDYSKPEFQVWNATTRFGFYLVSAVLAAAVRLSMDRERAAVRLDRLTGLLTSVAFGDQLERDLSRARAARQPASIACIAVEGLPAAPTGGQAQAEADRVLLAVAGVLIRVARNSETVARLGYDQFAVVVPEGGEAALRAVVSDIGSEIQAALRALGHRAACSIAVTTFQDASVPAAAAIAAALKQMSEVRNQARGQVRFAIRRESIVPTASGSVQRGPRHL